MSETRDSKFVDAMGQVLTFYSAELQSHAATLVSLAIGLFALLSVRAGGILGIVLFSIGGTVLPVLIVYSFLRLLVYGQLSKSILIGDDKLVDKYSADYKKQKVWDSLFPYTQVSHYTNLHFLEHWYKEKHFESTQRKLVAERSCAAENASSIPCRHCVVCGFLFVRFLRLVREDTVIVKTESLLEYCSCPYVSGSPHLEPVSCCSSEGPS